MGKVPQQVVGPVQQREQVPRRLASASHPTMAPINNFRHAGGADVLMRSLGVAAVLGPLAMRPCWRRAHA